MEEYNPMTPPKPLPTPPFCINCQHFTEESSTDKAVDIIATLPEIRHA